MLQIEFTGKFVFEMDKQYVNFQKSSHTLALQNASEIFREINLQNDSLVLSKKLLFEEIL